MKHGIDVSYAQGSIDFKKLKGKTDFVIIRAGYGRLASQKDIRFERNYKGCKAAGIPCGAYWFSYADSTTDARREARAFLKVIKGKKFEYPVWYDVEGQALSGGKAFVSSKCKAFCEEMEKAGYFVGIYSSSYPLQTFFTKEVRTRYAVWAAQYGETLDYPGPVGMWQNSSTGRKSGITGNVDTDICYEDYPEIIRHAHLNGY